MNVSIVFYLFLFLYMLLAKSCENDTEPFKEENIMHMKKVRVDFAHKVHSIFM